MTPKERANDIAGKCAAGRECDCEQEIAQALREHGNEKLEAAALAAEKAYGSGALGTDIYNTIRALKDEPTKEGEG